MKLAIINGSPRYKNSNSTLLMDQFLKGFSSKSEIAQSYLVGTENKKKALADFVESDTVLIIFPLYTDCKPGIVKEFFESLLGVENSVQKRVGFIVQSGFPESIHSEALERYLQKLTKRLGHIYLGTVIKGGVEGIKIMPPGMTKKLFGQFEKLGSYFAEFQNFDPKIMKQLRTPYKLSASRIFFFNLISKTGLTNFYWDMNLKKNNAFEQRFDKPFSV
ncbi:MAG TPA: NAD(P)H-dependent oxidoreductase [Paludibacter sp.]|nr:NAD(P)H-dependent oxidoreductase [Paludibacter sp.]